MLLDNVFYVRDAIAGTSDKLATRCESSSARMAFAASEHSQQGGIVARFAREHVPAHWVGAGRPPNIGQSGQAGQSHSTATNMRAATPETPTARMYLINIVGLADGRLIENQSPCDSDNVTKSIKAGVIPGAARLIHKVCCDYYLR
jgi:hypothetical protein